MNIAEYTIKNQVFSIIVILLVIFGGWTAYQNMARFEDPEFTIRVAQIYTPYPGASPLEVATEVTKPLETALQQMQEVDTVRSVSSAGVSEIQVEIKYEFSKTKSDLQIIWTKLRNKVADTRRLLPPDVPPPIVNDDFGDVYGIYYFLTGEGYTPAELRRYAKELKSELLQLDGVAKVALVGELKEAIYIEITRKQKAALGNAIYSILSEQNTVVAAGDVVIGKQRVLIDPSGEIDSVEAIKNLLVSASVDGKIVYLKDIADVFRDYQTPPEKLIRYNGQPAIALGISSVLGSNIVKIGKLIDDKIADSESRRPLGIEIYEYYHQGRIVEESVQNFLINVVAALVIVIVTLFIFMGMRSAIVIGTVLLLTIFATLLTMYISEIPMHRISLGALIIALGMMVDNAIVVTEGILVGYQDNRKRLDIIKAVVKQAKWPLLGGTLVGIIAFAPIGFAPGSTAEYTNHLFWVILISLLFSWAFALSLTPLFCYWLFKKSDQTATLNATESNFSLYYKKLIYTSLRMRWLVISITIGLFLISVWGFNFVKSGFFPASTSPQIVVDYWLPQGTDITQTHQDMLGIETFVGGLAGVNAVQTLIGGGGLRYMLVYSPESGNAAYGQILIRVDDYRQIDALIPNIQSFIDSQYPNAQAKVWRFVLGPGGGSKIEAVFKGPNTKTLRRLAEEAKIIMANDGGALSIKDDWRQPVSVIEPIYSEKKGRRAGISRENLAQALHSNFSGQSIGVYREGDDLISIIVRPPIIERTGVDDIINVQIVSPAVNKTVPISQITDGFRTLWRDGLLRRENRVWTIKAQSDPYPGQLAAELLGRIKAKIEAIKLPDGYTLEWGGEYGDSKESNENLAATIPFGLLAMVLVVFILFGSVRQPVVIWLVVPLALIGVVIGLLSTGSPLEFMAILGVLSLSGLLIKNAIVMVDQINVEMQTQKPRCTALIEAANSRVRPVLMGTITTILGVIPLFFDAFFQSMSVVIIFGLSFSTVLTLIIVPVLYAIFFRINYRET